MTITTASVLLTALLALATSPLVAKEIYTEDFASGKAEGWAPSKNRDWDVVAQGLGKAVYRAHYPYATSVYEMRSILATQTYGDLRFSVKVRNKGPYTTNIMARATPDFSPNADRGSGYGISLATEACGRNSSVLVYKLTDGVFEALQPWTVSTAIRCNDKVNRLTLRLQGGHIQLSINGTLVYDGTDPRPLGAGHIGLMGYTQEFLGTDHLFDDITVASPGPALAP